MLESVVFASEDITVCDLLKDGSVSGDDGVKVVVVDPCNGESGIELVEGVDVIDDVTGAMLVIIVNDVAGLELAENVLGKSISVTAVLELIKDVVCEAIDFTGVKLI